MEFISNGWIRVGLCPDRGGRIYSLSLMDGMDRFYHAPNPDTSTGWKNWGGDFLWVAPQSIWGWPPPNEWEIAPWSIVTDDDGVHMVSGLYRGTQLERQIDFDDTHSIKVTNMLRSVSEASDWGLWNITQLPVEGIVTSATCDGDIHVFDYPPDVSLSDLRASDQIMGEKSIQLLPNYSQDFKIGWYDPMGAITIEYPDGVRLTKQFDVQPRNVNYPHGGNVEFYRVKQYQEAEICWSRVHLEPGESISVTQRFILEAP